VRPGEVVRANMVPMNGDANGDALAASPASASATAATLQSQAGTKNNKTS
jgi:hypothetical protein